MYAISHTDANIKGTLASSSSWCRMSELPHAYEMHPQLRFRDPHRRARELTTGTQTEKAFGGCMAKQAKGFGTNWNCTVVSTLEISTSLVS